MTHSNKQLLKAASLTTLLLITGPIILVLSVMLLSANPLDGLFGVDENTSLQQDTLNLGIFLTLVGWITAVLMNLYLSIMRRQTDNRYFIIFGVVSLIPVLLYALWYI